MEKSSLGRNNGVIIKFILAMVPRIVGEWRFYLSKNLGENMKVLKVYTDTLGQY